MVKYSRKPTFRKSAPKRKMSTRRKPNSIVRTVNRIMKRNVETKSFITAVTESAISTLASPQTNNSIVLNAIGLNTSQSARIGMKINARYLNVRGAVFFPNDAPTIYTKIFVLMSDQNDDPINDLLETNGAVFGAAGSDFSAIYSRVNTTKYKVLATKIVKTGVLGGLQQTGLFNVTCNLKDQIITYENNSGNTTPSNKKITIHYYSRRADNDESLGITGEITWNSKFYFTDM